MKLSNTKLSAMPAREFVYRINIDERGSFMADVYNADTNETVFTILAGAELDAGDTSIFDDGYMQHPNDLAGLYYYLIDLGILRPQDVLFDGE